MGRPTVSPSAEWTSVAFGAQPPREPHVSAVWPSVCRCSNVAAKIAPTSEPSIRLRSSRPSASWERVSVGASSAVTAA